LQLIGRLDWQVSAVANLRKQIGLTRLHGKASVQ
jgi:hypothetical protein